MIKQSEVNVLLLGSILMMVAMSEPCFGVGKIQLTFVTGFDYSERRRNSIFRESIDTIPLLIKLESKNWIGRMQFLRHRITYRNSAFEGNGDTYVHLAKKATLSLSGLNYLDYGVKVKIPTASEENGLGTGEEDWILQLNAFRSDKSWTFNTTFGHQWLGQGSVYTIGVPDNASFATIGLQYRSRSNWSGGALLDYNGITFIQREEKTRFIPYIVYRVSKRFSTSFYRSLSIPDTSIENGYGIQFIFRYPKF